MMKPLDEQSVTPYFNSNLLRDVGIIDDDDWFEFIEQVINQINIFCTSGSGWVVQKLINVGLKVSKGRAPLWKHCWSPSKKKHSCVQSLSRINFQPAMVQYLLTPDQIVLSKSFYHLENSINKLVDCLRRWLKFSDGKNQKYRDLKKVLVTEEREQLLRSSAENCCLRKSEIESDVVIHHNHATDG